MKEKVLSIIKIHQGVVEDNLYRAKRRFQKMTSDQLAEEYGFSGRSCAEILEAYQAEADEIKRCVAWVETAK